jgi:hypothetical protein
MGTIQQIRHVVFAGFISIMLNGFLLAVASSIDPGQEKLSIVARTANVLLEPGEALTEQLAPGHSGAQIVVLFVSSILIYAFVAWIFLSLPAWWRSRA